MRNYVNRYRGFSRTSKSVFWVILGVMILIGLYGFFTSEIGRTISLVCCGGIILLVIVGALSERGMNRSR